VLSAKTQLQAGTTRTNAPYHHSQPICSICKSAGPTRSVCSCTACAPVHAALLTLYSFTASPQLHTRHPQPRHTAMHITSQTTKPHQNNTHNTCAHSPSQEAAHHQSLPSPASSPAAQPGHTAVNIHYTITQNNT
jgi:hypothetical protein